MVKTFLCLSLLLCLSAAAEDSPPVYRDEASLPKNWPKPGPYNQVSQKTYPAYRAAFTDGKGTTGAFWRLFRHIQRNDIPMTAPVEMAMKDGSMTSMAFLYQNIEVGTTGPDGEKIQVRDVPALKALSYTWMGPRNKKSLKKAKEALEKALGEKNLTAKSFRLLGYNGPRTPKKKRTHELQAIL